MRNDTKCNYTEHTDIRIMTLNNTTLDTQHNDAQLNGTKHIDITQQNDIQPNYDDSVRLPCFLSTQYHLFLL